MNFFLFLLQNRIVCDIIDTFTILHRAAPLSAPLLARLCSVGEGEFYG